MFLYVVTDGATLSVRGLKIDGVAIAVFVEDLCYVDVLAAIVEYYIATYWDDCAQRRGYGNRCFL